MIAKPIMGNGETVLTNTPTAMAAMVNQVMTSNENLRSLNLLANDSDPSTLRAIGQVLDTMPRMRNAFQAGIWNMVSMIIINNMYWTKDDWVSKTLKGQLEVGDSIEDIWVEVATPHDYDANGASKLTTWEKAEILSKFHILNYQKYYQRTIGRKDFRQAFLSFSGVYTLVQKIIDSMYNAARWDYFLICKYLIARKICDGAFQVATVEAPADEASVKEDAKVIQRMSNDMTYPDGFMNEAGVINATAKEDQLFIPTNEFEAAMNVEVLASAFNMDKVGYNGIRLPINGFSFTATEENRIKELMGESEGYREITAGEKAELLNCYAVHMDKDWFFNYNYLFEFYEFEDPSVLKENFFLHDWKLISYSPYRNAVVYTSMTPTVTEVQITPDGATVQKGSMLQLTATVTATGFAKKTVAWSVSGGTDNTTSIDANGLLYVGANETANLTVKAVSTVDAGKSDSVTITVPQS